MRDRAKDTTKWKHRNGHGQRDTTRSVSALQMIRLEFMGMLQLLHKCAFAAVAD